ncbi:MAG: hypothetical protein ABI760_20280 [Ferruginibacter sp.]
MTSNDGVNTFKKAVKELNNAVKTCNANKGTLFQSRNDPVSNRDNAVEAFLIIIS